MSSMNSDRIKILVCCHKKSPLPAGEIYLPVHVGAAISNVDLQIQRDDEVNGEKCDNISDKNKVYCEMTAMYWAWKNIKKIYPDLEYIGLCHYRRFFSGSENKSFNKKEKLRQIFRTAKKVLRNRDFGCNFYAPERKISEIDDSLFAKENENLVRIVEQNEIVMTTPVVFMDTNIQNYFNLIGHIYIEKLIQIVESEYPEYVSALKTVLGGNKISSANMIIMKTSYLDDYASFVFGVLKKHIEVMKSENICADPLTEGIYARISGFLSELLTNTYFVKQNVKKCYVDKIYIA